VGTFTRYAVAASLATLGIILAAIYILWMYQRTMTGPVREEVAGWSDLKGRELWAVGPLIALIIVLGVYPKPVLDIINPAVHATQVQLNSPDPVPPHPAATGSTTGDLRHPISAVRPAIAQAALHRVEAHPKSAQAHSRQVQTQRSSA